MFKSHHLYGSSLLLLFDLKRKSVSAKVIDIRSLVDRGSPVADHRLRPDQIPLPATSTADGYLTGLENLVHFFEDYKAQTLSIAGSHAEKGSMRKNQTAPVLSSVNTQSTTSAVASPSSPKNSGTYVPYGAEPGEKQVRGGNMHAHDAEFREKPARELSPRVHGATHVLGQGNQIRGIGASLRSISPRGQREV